MFKKWFESYASIILFVLCFTFIRVFRSVVILYLLAKFFVLFVEGIVRLLADTFQTLASRK